VPKNGWQGKFCGINSIVQNSPFASITFVQHLWHLQWSHFVQKLSENSLAYSIQPKTNAN
jgi:hypothetical protein